VLDRINLRGVLELVEACRRPSRKDELAEPVHEPRRVQADDRILGRQVAADRLPDLPRRPRDRRV